jgi:hypothetical protein
MLPQWLTVNPVAHGALILLLGIVLGYVVYLALVRLVGQRTVAGSSTGGFLAVRRFKLPLILMVLSIFADDAIERAGMKGAWWGDDLLAALQSLPLISFTWVLTMVCRSYFARMIERNISNQKFKYFWLGLFTRLSPVIFLPGLNRQISVELFAEDQGAHFMGQGQGRKGEYVMGLGQNLRGEAQGSSNAKKGFLDSLSTQIVQKIKPLFRGQQLSSLI